jgi:hypothetical protein
MAKKLLESQAHTKWKRTNKINNSWVDPGILVELA